MWRRKRCRQGLPQAQSSTASAVEQTIGVVRGGLQGFPRCAPGDEDLPPERFGTVLKAAGDMRTGVIRADGGRLFAFQLPPWFSIEVGARVSFAPRREMELLPPMTCRFVDRSGVGGLASPHSILGASGAPDSAGAVHSSSCGAHRGVFHSPFCFYFRCHCNWCDLVLSSAVCFGSSAPLCCESVCVAMSCGGGFTPGGAYDSVWDSVKPKTGQYFLNYFQYQVDVGSVAC